MNEVITSSQIQILDSSSFSISITNGPGHSPFDSKFNGKDISGKFSMTRENINELVRIVIMFSAVQYPLLIRTSYNYFHLSLFAWALHTWKSTF